MARAFELAAQEPRLIARHLAWLEKHKGQLSTLVERRLAGRHAVRVLRRDRRRAALMFLVHATFLRLGRRRRCAGSADEHLAAVVAELRAILSD